MIKPLIAWVAMASTPAFAQIATGSNAVTPSPTPYSPASLTTAPRTTPSGLGTAMTPGSAIAPALPQPVIGVTPPVGSPTSGAIGSGRVGTLATTTTPN